MAYNKTDADVRNEVEREMEASKGPLPGCAVEVTIKWVAISVGVMMLEGFVAEFYGVELVPLHSEMMFAPFQATTLALIGGGRFLVQRYLQRRWWADFERRYAREKALVQVSTHSA